MQWQSMINETGCYRSWPGSSRGCCSIVGSLHCKGVNPVMHKLTCTAAVTKDDRTLFRMAIICMAITSSQTSFKAAQTHLWVYTYVFSVIGSCSAGAPAPAPLPRPVLSASGETAALPCPPSHCSTACSEQYVASQRASCWVPVLGSTHTELHCCVRHCRTQLAARRMTQRALPRPCRSRRSGAGCCSTPHRCSPHSMQAARYLLLWVAGTRRLLLCREGAGGRPGDDRRQTSRAQCPCGRSDVRKSLQRCAKIRVMLRVLAQSPALIAM